jgi:hypothetical protein
LLLLPAPALAGIKEKVAALAPPALVLGLAYPTWLNDNGPVASFSPLIYRRGPDFIFKETQ